MNIKDFFKKGEKYIEIGPLDNPFLKRPEYDVYYSDFNTTEKVKELYKDSYAVLSKIVDIDYPTEGKSLKETVGNVKFAGAFSSHCIEHTHDVIRHLVDVGEVLEEGGKYVLCIPDKSNCFDCFRNVVSFREAYNVYIGNGVNSLIADAIINTSTFNGADDVKYFWNKQVSLIPNLVLEEPRIAMAKEVYQSKDPLSYAPCCHIWTFTYESLLEFLRDCLRFHLLPFTIEYHASTVNENNYNLYVVLRKDSKMLVDNTLCLNEIIKIQTFLEKKKGINSPLTKCIDENKMVYIYGAGVRGKQVYNFLKTYTKCEIAFLVSDNQDNNSEDLPAPVYKLSKLMPKENFIIIIATINSKYYMEMDNNLRLVGYKQGYHYFRW